MAGETAPTATVQPVDGQAYTHSLSGSPDGEVWVRIEPTQSGTIHVELDGGAKTPYADFYLVVGAINDPFSYDRWIGYAGDNTPYITTPHGGISAEAGEVYLLAIYEAPGFGVSTMSVDITLTYEGPANDKLTNAEVVTPGYQQVITGTTINGSQEPDEFDNWDGNQDPSVWYKIVPGGPGQITINLESTTPGFHPGAQVFYRTSGPVTGFLDLTEDVNQEIGDGTENPPTYIYDKSGTSLDGDKTPLAGGEEFYLRVAASAAFNNEYEDQGSFIMTISIATNDVCLTATDYINGASSTASIVGDAVRETATFHAAGPLSDTEPYETFIADQTPTLIIPVADILGANGAGFYAVSLKSKNNDNAGSPPMSIGGFRRNGQPIYPGSFITSTASSTPVVGWLTAWAGTDFDDESPADNDGDGFSESFHQLMWLPVHPNDNDLEIVICGQLEFGSPKVSSQIDVTQICFQKMIDAQPAPPYDMLDVPDYPLGTVEADLEDATGKLGDIVNLFEPTVATTFVRVQDVEGQDMCVTDDGVIWVACNLEVDQQTANPRFIGPALVKWDPASPGWVLVHNDIEGLGFKRTSRSGGALGNLGAPSGISMDTDGTDIWIAYGVIDNLDPVGAGRQEKLRVKKFTVSGASFSNVGGLIEYKGSARVRWGAQVADFDSTSQIRLSPAGVPWVAFRDILDGELTSSSTPNLIGGAEAAFAAKWTGSTWEVQQLPYPSWRDGFSTNAEIIAASSQHEAESIINGGSATATTTSGGGETVVQETQTTHAARTMLVTPPAGKWMILARMRTDSSTMTAGFRTYKNGSEIFGAEGTGALQSAAGFAWGVAQNNDFYFETDGNDEIGISIRKVSGTATNIWIDKVWFIPVEAAILLFPLGSHPGLVTFVNEAGIVQVQLAFPDGENPRAIYNIDMTKYTDDPNDHGYIAPEESIFSAKYTYYPWVYCKFNGTTWNRPWEAQAFEDWLPDQIEEKTRYEPWGPTAVGLWTQGTAVTTAPDGTVYLAFLGGIQVNGGSNAYMFILTDDGPEAPWRGPPGIIGGTGAPFNYGATNWGWVCADSAIQVTPRGAIFFAYSIWGVVAEFEESIVTYVPNGHGDWYLASEHNNPIGQTQFDWIDGSMAQSPNGDTIYNLGRFFIHDGATTVEDSVFGVWACPVIEDAKIPLIPVVGGEVNMNIRTSRRMDVVRLNQ